MGALKTKNLTFIQGAFQINQLSLAIEEGKMTAIVGPNGSGKSTLLKLFARLYKAEAGEILLKDLPITQIGRKEFSKKITMLLQSKEIFPNITVEELVSYGRTPHQKGLSRMNKEDREILEWALHECQLMSYKDRMLHTLSGGELQRARIAMALAQKTEILLLDEPTTYLDITHVMELMELMKKINQKYGMTIVMVLHELSFAGAYCDNLVVMKKGSVYKAGNPQDILTSKLLEEVYEIDAMIKYENSFPMIIPNKKNW
ncbi:ABC transporter ATP-binding protein [Niallia circulans]|uniref:ABC transporter ATP-binding protein n=1 Tax=Niallia circulans TaxID=1397 RepID=A0A941GFT7_NIACI|nr:ABC transporter ATP-binding protein [Niallia circulans]MCB5239548.1 ABC transporter ATP-binding protein [Niallia circulans]